MTETASSDTVASIREAIRDAPEEEREDVKARFREAELLRDEAEQRQTVLDLTEPAEPRQPAEGSDGEQGDGGEEHAPPAPSPPLAAAADGEGMYSREALKEGARELFDVSPHIVAGALAGNPSQTFTLDDAERLVRSFAEREHGGPEA